MSVGQIYARRDDHSGDSTIFGISTKPWRERERERGDREGVREGERERVRERDGGSIGGQENRERRRLEAAMKFKRVKCKSLSLNHNQNYCI